MVVVMMVHTTLHLHFNQILAGTTNKMFIFRLVLIVRQGVKAIEFCTIDFVENFDKKPKKKFDQILCFTIDEVILIVVVVVAVAINRLVVIIVLMNITAATVNQLSIIVTLLKGEAN